MGLLNTIESLLTVMEGQPEIIDQLRPTVLHVVGHIFSQSVMGKLKLCLFCYCNFFVTEILMAHG